MPNLDARADGSGARARRILVLGGTWFLRRRIAERLHERGDGVLVVHRGHHTPPDWVPVQHLLCDRHDLASRRADIDTFAPDAVVDTCALTGADVDAVLPALSALPAVVLSSQDVYEAHAGLRTGHDVAALPLDEEAELRRERYPYRGLGLHDVPDDYEKLDVEQRWLAHGATVLRLPLVYGPHDWQRREEPVLRRIRARRPAIPVGAGNLLWTRGHVDDLATGVLAALDTRAADGMPVNLGEPVTHTIGWWLARIVEASGAGAELVRVPDHLLPPDLTLTAAPAQHLLVSVARARQLLSWSPRPARQRIAESVHWHLAHPPEGPTWDEADTAADDAALTARISTGS